MRLKCFAMVKDEIDIFEDWLRHTLDIFGPGNVYVLDNESSDGTEEVLRRYRAEVWSKSVKASADGADGPSKGQHITALMREHRNDCDLLVPLDGDEFIGLQNSWDRDGIRAAFEELDIRRYGRFKFTLTYQVIPTIEDVPLPARSLTDFTVTSDEFREGKFANCAKTFYSAEAFVSTDNGNHIGDSALTDVYHSSLWHYHYHARSLNQFRQKILKGASYSNYWTKHQFSRDWQRAYKAHMEGRFQEYFEATQLDVPKHRKVIWAADRLRSLDADSRMPARTGVCETAANS